MRKVIVNSTPIIGLSDIGQLDLLRQIYGNIFIPEAVEKEILSEPARTLVETSEWIIKLPIKDLSSKMMYRAKLHAGEVEVMILAQESGADLIILDDNAAKKTAKYLGLTVTGTLGVLLKAKKIGLIQQVKPLMDQLEESGFFISDRVKEMVLKQANET